MAITPKYNHCTLSFEIVPNTLDVERLPIDMVNPVAEHDLLGRGLGNLRYLHGRRTLRGGCISVHILYSHAIILPRCQITGTILSVTVCDLISKVGKPHFCLLYTSP